MRWTAWRRAARSTAAMSTASSMTWCAAVETGMSPLRRRLLHRRAERPEQLDRHAVDALAYHYEAADEPLKAAISMNWLPACRGVLPGTRPRSTACACGRCNCNSRATARPIGRAVSTGFDPAVR